jgi:hypothetical protein
LFRFYTETKSFDDSIEPKQTEDPPEQFEGEYIWVIFRKFRVVSVCFGLLRNSSEFCLFRLFRYRVETPKQTEIFSFWLHETNRNKPEIGLVSVCFGSNRNLFLFVSRTLYLGPLAASQRSHGGRLAAGGRLGRPGGVVLTCAQLQVTLLLLLAVVVLLCG